MLTTKEKSEIEILLKSLTSDQLVSLAYTVSKGHVESHTEEESIKVIVAFEKSARDFLRHKIITRNKLAEYAYQKKLHVSECEHKEDFVQLILTHWSESDRVQTRIVHSVNQGSSPIENSWVRPDSTGPTILNHNSCNSNPGDVEFLYGQNFCQWFYNMLNHPDPVSQGFGPIHFNTNAQMLLKRVSVGDLYQISLTNNKDISDCLLDLSKQFTFNPNISADGLKVKSDPHGLKMVLICGTLFKGTSLCGSFEQSFGLVKDPHIANNWKIHVTALKCSEALGHIASHVEDPILEEVALTALQTVKSLTYHS